jgi:hypothetical protein
LFISAKDLFIEAKALTGPGTKTFEMDQSFEPGARNRRLTAVGAALKMSARIMSDEFDSLDATEKAAVEAALNRCRTLAAQIASDDQGPVAAPSWRFSFCLSSRTRVLTGPDTPSAANSWSGTRFV